MQSLNRRNDIFIFVEKMRKNKPKEDKLIDTDMSRSYNRRAYVHELEDAYDILKIKG